MAIREYEFTSGPETAALPTVGTPSAPDDLLTLGFADDRYTQGSEAVADNAALKAIADGERRDGDLVLVKDSDRLYRFNSASVDADDGNFVLAPDAGTGRWLRYTILNKANTFTENQIIDGDLTVNGTTTTVDSETLDVKDPNIGVNRGGNQATANSSVSGVTVQMTDATDARVGYDSSLTSKFKAGESGSESEIITASTAQTITGLKSVDPGLSFDTLAATPANPAADYLKLYAKDDGNFYKLDENGNEIAVGSGGGSGEINYIDNWDFESGTTDWSTYDDGAVSAPVDGSGGVSSNLTLSQETSVVLRGAASLKIAKGAADAQGEGVSYDFTIKGQDISKKLKIQFDFKTDEDAGYASGDLTVYIYDVTNSTLITPVDTSIIRGQNIFQTSFNSTTSTSYRLIFHVATTNATAWDAYIDNVIVGPGMTSQGAVVGPWTAYTPTITGTSSNPTVNGDFRSYYRRVGDSMEILFVVDQTSAGAAGLGGYLVSIPSGFTIDTNVIECPSSLSSLDSTVGHGLLWDGSQRSVMSVQTYSNTTVFLTGVNEVAEGTWGNAFVPFSGATVKASFQAKLPIAEWAGKGIVPMLAEDNLSEWQAYTPTGAWNTNVTYTGYWKRVGDSMLVQGNVALTGAPNSGTFTFEIPTGYTIDTSKMPNVAQYFTSVFGHANGKDGGSGTVFTPVYNSTNSITLLYQSNISTAAATLVSDTTPVTWASGDSLAVSFMVPIVEFAGSQNSLVGYSQADGTNTGLLPPVTSMSDALATQLGHKEYTESDVTLTPVSPITGFTVSNARFIPYQMSSGNWRLKFNINLTSIVSTGSYSGWDIFTVSGISVAFNQTFAIEGFGPAVAGFVDSNDNKFAVTFSSATATNGQEYNLAGDIELASKPTWAT